MLNLITTEYPLGFGPSKNINFNLDVSPGKIVRLDASTDQDMV